MTRPPSHPPPLPPLQEAAALAAEHAHEFLPYTTAYQAAEKLPPGAVDAAVRAIAEAQVLAETKRT